MSRHLTAAETQALLAKSELLPTKAVTVVGLKADAGELCEEHDPIALIMQCPNGCCAAAYILDTACAADVSEALAEALTMRAGRAN